MIYTFQYFHPDTVLATPSFPRPGPTCLRSLDICPVPQDCGMNELILELSSLCWSVLLFLSDTNAEIRLGWYFSKNSVYWPAEFRRRCLLFNFNFIIFEYGIFLFSEDNAQAFSQTKGPSFSKVRKECKILPRSLGFSSYHKSGCLEVGWWFIPYTASIRLPLPSENWSQTWVSKSLNETVKIMVF